MWLLKLFTISQSFGCPSLSQDSRVFSCISKKRSQNLESVFSSCWIRRLVHPSFYDEDNFTTGDDKETTSLTNNGTVSELSVSRSMGQSISCTQNKIGNGSSQDQSCNCPSRCGDVLQPSPVEDCDNPSGPLDHSSYKDSQDPHVGSQSVNSTMSLNTPSIDPTIGISDGKQEENRATRLSKFSIGSNSSVAVKPMNGYLQLVHLYCHLIPIDQDMHPSEATDKSYDSTQTSSRSKRKKAPENDDCMHCKCMKSKCLKLYCDCLASGEYCDESCACQDCFNKPEYEDIIYQTRQKIESRNPIAFSQNGVPYAMEFTNEVGDSNIAPPTVGRRRIGCNCKKSLCLKNYCECYQANVGCSLGCQCRGCQNSFGRK